MREMYYCVKQDAHERARKWIYDIKRKLRKEKIVEINLENFHLNKFFKDKVREFFREKL